MSALTVLVLGITVLTVIAITFRSLHSSDLSEFYVVLTEMFCLPLVVAKVCIDNPHMWVLYSICIGFLLWVIGNLMLSFAITLVKGVNEWV